MMGPGAVSTFLLQTPRKWGKWSCTMGSNWLFGKEPVWYYKSRCSDLWCVYDHLLDQKRQPVAKGFTMGLKGKTGSDWIKLLVYEANWGHSVLLNYQVTDSFNNHCTFGLLTITLCNARSASSMTKGAKGVDKAGNNWTSIDIWAGGDYMYKQLDWFIRKWI